LDLVVVPKADTGSQELLADGANTVFCLPRKPLNPLTFVVDHWHPNCNCHRER
jgi:hypothetical protein